MEIGKNQIKEVHRSRIPKVCATQRWTLFPNIKADSKEDKAKHLGTLKIKTIACKPWITINLDKWPLLSSMVLVELRECFQIIIEKEVVFKNREWLCKEKKAPLTIISTLNLEANCPLPHLIPKWLLFLPRFVKQQEDRHQWQKQTLSANLLKESKGQSTSI